MSQYFFAPTLASFIGMWNSNGVFFSRGLSIYSMVHEVREEPWRPQLPLLDSRVRPYVTSRFFNLDLSSHISRSLRVVVMTLVENLSG
jgi:hypothetical protein